MRPDNTNRLRSDGFSTPSIHSQPHHQGGFTLIELLITLVIVAVLFGVSSINLGKSQQTANITATVDVLLADIKSQQSLAMFGGLGGTATAQSHGIYVQPKFYTLFPGTTYSAVNPNNFVISIPNSLSLSTTLPSTETTFTKGSGEVLGYVGGSDTITVTGLGSSRTFTINRFGAVGIN
jgi:prepilin-type N-terminal cleavage/methylation domain-containing protein